jgi:hypothetical protein
MNAANDEIRLSHLLYATKRKQGGYNVTYCNGVAIGTFEYGDDGYLYYWPSSKEGCWASHPMRAIADLLDHLNAPWDEQIRRDLSA